MLRDDEEDAEDLEVIPQFSLTVFDEADFQIDRAVALPTNPDDRPASMALLYGLALLTLDQDGTIQKRMLDLLKSNQSITQQAACDSIRLLLMEEPNVQLA